MEGLSCQAATGRAHIAQALGNLRQQRGGEVVTTCSGRERTGEEFARDVEALTRALQHRGGLAAGERVAIAALNSEWYLDWLLAVPSAGAIIAPLNYRWSVEECAQAVSRVGASMLVVDNQCMPLWPALQVACPSLRTGILMEEVASTAAPALGCTTGTPKGAALTHAGLVSQSLAKLAVVGYSQQDVFLHASPLCHIGGISSALAMLMACGSHVFLPRFQSQICSTAIKYTGKDRQYESVSTLLIGAGKTPSNMMQAVRKLFCNARILSAYGAVRILEPAVPHLEQSISILASAWSWLSAMEQNVKAQGNLAPHGTYVVLAGMTEVSSSITFCSLQHPALSTKALKAAPALESRAAVDCQANIEKSIGTCVGSSAPHIEVRIAPTAHHPSANCSNDSLSMGQGEEGEVEVRGLPVMAGYWGQEDETRNALREGGWLRTGDVGRLDGDGNLWLLGRAKDMVKTGGENVHAAEVEGVLASHPGIAAAAVVGLPDDRLGEVVSALVVVKDGWSWGGKKRGNEAAKDVPLVESSSAWVLSPESLRHHCSAQGLSRYKLPRVIFGQCGTLPITSTGKVRKNDVRQTLLQLAAIMSGNKNNNRSFYSSGNTQTAASRL